ncbi:response regulator transcription factor [Pedobacter frigiditerrae]|uniref:Response regulator transcription factor n=1 Tax=Pedobacter frigiditerrae TaxID=2530452 RepID=A0A4R0MPX2_9SPHI|nr:LytTR family DNA-binding domain-containing protein [Pedobacter frigiditerrae]TCC88044.1 response regulator transcription factor [Pedobacter frigiditerrae]
MSSTKSPTYSCYVIDDELHSVESLKDHIGKMSELRLIGSYTNPLIALEEIRNGKKPDIIFLDVDMPEMSGIEVTELLPKDIIIIFTTAHSKYALQAFQLDVLDFLLKPFNHQMFLKSVTKAIERIGKATPKAEIESIFINPGTKGKIVQLTIARISHIEALDHSVCINTPPERFVTNVNLKEIEAKLPPSKFARVHRSFIINVDQIQSIEANFIVLQNNERIPLGEAYKKSLKERIQHKTITGF